MTKLSCPICRAVKYHKMDCQNRAYVACQLAEVQAVSDRWQKDCRWYQDQYADCATELKEAKATIVTLQARVAELEEGLNQASSNGDGWFNKSQEANARVEELEEHNQNAQSLNGLLELRVEELKGLLERGYSLMKPPPVQERFKNIVDKARAAWLTDVLEVLTQETKDGD